MLPIPVYARTLRLIGSVSQYRQLDQTSVHLAMPLLV
nr:MAG TPA: hypothetical protein [Caudoviricetes sp.]